MTDDVVLNGKTAKQIKMRQFTVALNHIKRGFQKIAKEEFNTKICTSTVNAMLCKQEFGMFKIMPYDYTLSQGFTDLMLQLH